jgi:hypothetical protein
MEGGGVPALSRIVVKIKVILIASTQTEEVSKGYTYADSSVNRDGDKYQVLDSNKRNSTEPTKVRQYLGLV